MERGLSGAQPILLEIRHDPPNSPNQRSILTHRTLSKLPRNCIDSYFASC